MTILFFARFFYPHIGGVEKHVSEISKRLIKKGHKVIVVTEQLLSTNIPIYLQLKEKYSKLSEKEIIENILVYRIPVGSNNWLKKFRIWIWLFRNIDLISKADIIHCHDVFFWYLPFRFLYPKKKIFVTFHGYEKFPVSKKAIVVRRISEKLSFGNICIGDFIKKWYGTKPDFVSYGGVDIPKSATVNNIKESAVFMGRLDEQTGILIYVKAFKKIKEKIPDFKFSVFGEGKFKDKIRPYVDYEGETETATEEIRKYNFVFASRYLSILEAMAAKRLVLAVYDNPLKEDYLKISPFAKYITIVNSSDKVAEKAIYLLENPDEAKNMIRDGFNWVKNQTWENVANMYVKLWQRNR